MNIQNNIFLSIIVPTYNRADLVGQTLKSLQDQSYKNYEIIVVDDGSTDNTEAVVKAIADERIIYVKKNNAERAAARNFGAAMAKGSYINFFDSDDLALPNHLSEAINLLSNYKEPEWFYLSYAIKDPIANTDKNAHKYTGETLNKRLVGGNILSCNGVFIRKDIILSYLFNEDRLLSASEDYELWCRLAARFPLYYSNTVTSVIIDHDLRSVRKINGNQLITRLSLVVHYLRQDKESVKYYGSNLNKIEMYAYSYISVHLSDQAEYKKKSIYYLIKAFSKSPSIIKKKIFYAIIKNLLFKW